MMRDYVRGVNPKYVRKIPFLGLLPILMLFLPVIGISGEKINVSGFRIGLDALKQGNIQLVLVFLGIELVILLCSIIDLLRPSRISFTITVIAYALYVIGMISVMLTIKKLVDGSGLVSTEFLIKYMGIGYWLGILAGLICLVMSMKAIRMNPGYIVLVVMCVVWLFPLVWIVLTSFRAEQGFYVGYLIPRDFTLDNYVKLFTDTSSFKFGRWYLNTLVLACANAVFATLITISTAFILSRIRFHGRKALMNLMLILGMFPGFMSMIAVYYILKGIGLSQSLLSLAIVYAAGSALGYYVSKGFFDTIPKALDEAAFLDGATKWDLFTRITLPLSKPILVYTILGSFMAPWGDYIFSSIILGDKSSSYTVAIGLYHMIGVTFIEEYYTRFAAGAILVSLPIAILFISLQKYYVDGLSGSVKG